jgi:hypothetical protein
MQYPYLQDQRQQSPYRQPVFPSPLQYHASNAVNPYRQIAPPCIIARCQGRLIAQATDSTIGNDPFIYMESSLFYQRCITDMLPILIHEKGEHILNKSNVCSPF